MPESPHIQWPGYDDRSVVTEMLANGLSPHWEKCENYVLRYIQRKFPSLQAHLQNEAKQETMVAIHLSLAEFRFESRLTTWVVTIARHKVIDIQRKLKIDDQWMISSKDDPENSETEENIFRIDVSSSPVENLLIIEELEEIRAALHEFIEQHKHQARNTLIIRLVMYEERSCEETARILQLKAPLVSYVVREARKFLAKRFPHLAPHHRQPHHTSDQ